MIEAAAGAADWATAAARRRPEPCLSFCIYEKGRCKFCGWPKDRSKMALRYFDPRTGDTRDLTAADLEELELIRASHGRIMSFLNSEKNLLAELLRKHRERHETAKKEVTNHG